MRFTPPTSGSTRLSADVWALICHHAEHNGNSSIREALEQLVRQTLGPAQTINLTALDPPQPQPPTSPAPAVNNAAAALDALLLD